MTALTGGHRGLSHIAGQARRYLSVFSWLLADSIGSQPRHWRIILAATVASLAANVGAVAVIYWYVSLLEAGGSAELLGRSLVARESTGLLLVAVVALGALLLLYAVSQYVARSHAIRASRLFEERCSGGALKASCRLPDPRAADAERVLQECQLIHLVTMNARYCGMAVRLLANGLGALLVFTVCMLVLFWLDAAMTSIVVLVGSVIVAAQYPPVKAAAAEGKRWAETRKAVNRGMASLLRRLNSAPRHAALAGNDGDAGRFLDSDQVQGNLDAWEGRLRAIDRSTLTMQLGGGLLLAGLVLFVGLSFIRGDQDWAGLIVYVTMLRLLLANLTSVFRAVTGVSRFYPQIQSYRDFTNSAMLAGGAADTGPVPAPGAPLTLAAVDRQGRPGPLQLLRGRTYAIMAPDGYGRDLLGNLARAAQAARANEGPHAAWAMDLATRPPRAEWFDGVPAPDDAGGLDGWLDRMRSERTVLHGIEAAVAGGADLVLVDRLAIDALAAGDRAACADRLTTRVLLVVYQENYPVLADRGEDKLLVVDDSGALVWFDVPASGLGEAERQAIRAVRARRPGGSARLDDLDESVD